MFWIHQKNFGKVNNNNISPQMKHSSMLVSMREKFYFCSYFLLPHLFFFMLAEDDKFHGEYEKAMKYFDIMSRLELVNTRLEVMNDMNQILMDAAQNHHARVLEWAVIASIVVEILVEVFRTYRDIF